MWMSSQKKKQIDKIVVFSQNWWNVVAIVVFSHVTAIHGIMVFLKVKIPP